MLPRIHNFKFIKNKIIKLINNLNYFFVFNLHKIDKMSKSWLDTL